MNDLSFISPDQPLDLAGDNLSSKDIMLSRGPSIERDKVIDDFSRDHRRTANLVIEGECYLKTKTERYKRH
jgi:hypothetical protein